MQKNRTLVLGASLNADRYSNLAVKKLMAFDQPVLAIGNKPGNIGNTQIITAKKDFEDIDTITLYINPTHQKEWYPYIFSLHPRRIIFNPGTENDELYDLAIQKGIIAQEACTLVLLSTGQY